MGFLKYQCRNNIMAIKNWRIFYDRKAVLGRGTFGRVFLGNLVNKDTNVVEMQVAIKRIVVDELPESEIHLLDRECVQLELNHPNVVKLLHWEDQGDFRCYALELCDVSLNKVFEDMEKYQEFIPGQLEFMLQLSLGLEYIHNQCLVHRDIKPGNVLISKSFNTVGKLLVKWADFGFSKTTDTRGRFDLSGPRGTKCYWAPEIYVLLENNRLNRYEIKKEDGNDATKEISTMSDVFSSGCVFFEFCTGGIHPFGNGEAEINMNLIQCTPINFNGSNLPNSHFGYKHIRNMLENEPNQRPNLRELIQSLSSLKKMVLMDQKSSTRENEEQAIQENCVISYLNESKILKEINETQQKLEKMKDELQFFCSLANQTEEQINRISQLVAKDKVGLVNMVDDENGFSSLQLLCLINNNNALHSITALLSKPRWQIGEGLKVDINYQNRNGFNALHYLCMNYQGDDLLEILELLADYGELDVNKYDHAMQRNNVLQMFLLVNQRNDAADIVKALIALGVNLNHVDLNGWTAFHFLCGFYTHKDLIDLAQLLIDNGVDTNAKTFEGWTAVSLLCFNYAHDNMINIIRLLIDNEAELDAKDSDGWTVLHFLSCGNYTHDNIIDIIRLFVNERVDVNAKDPHGCTVLHYLCRHYPHDNLIDIIQLLIQNGIDVEAKDFQYGWSAFHAVCAFYTHNNLIQLMKLLISKEVDLNAKGFDNCTALHLLCANYSHDNLIILIRFLIDHEIEVDSKLSDGWTALHYLCRNYTHDNLIDVARSLIDNGVDVNAKTANYGWTALHFLCTFYIHGNLIDTARLLIDKGTDAGAKDADGCTALHALCRYYKHDNLIDLIWLLINEGTSIESKMSTGWSALHIVCRYYNHDNLIGLVQLLIEKGVEATTKTQEGVSTLLCLCQNYRQNNLIDIIRLLIDKGVDVNANESDGWTALHYVCRHYPHENMVDVIQLLIEKGVDVSLETKTGNTALEILNLYYSQKNKSNLVKIMIDAILKNTK